MKHKGSTLIELILYVILLAIFMTGVVTYGILAITTRAKVKVEEEVISNVRLAVKRIAFEIRNASAINSIGEESITLANIDSARNPTTISKSGTRVAIGWGVSGDCPVDDPCFLTSNDVIIHKLSFLDMSDIGTKSANIRFSISAKGVNPSNLASYEYVTSSTTSAEVRSN